MDLEILFALQNARTPALSAFMNVCSYLAHEILVVVILCALYWCFNKEIAYRLSFSYFVSGMIVQGLKVAFRVPRPWVRDSRLFVDKYAEEAATGYSFPSGHTQTATSLYGAVAFFLKKWWAYLAAFVIVGLIMFSRMFLGCHTPQDVGVSFLISFILVVVVSVIYDHVKVTPTVRTVVFLLLEIASIAIYAFTVYSMYSGRVLPEDYNNAYDAIKIAGSGMGFGIAYYLERNFLNFNPRQSKKVWVIILKILVGAGVALALKELPKKLITETSPAGLVVMIHTIRYILAILWVVYIYPLIFTKILNKKCKAQ